MCASVWHLIPSNFKNEYDSIVCLCHLLSVWWWMLGLLLPSETVNGNGVAGLMVSPFIGDICLHLFSSYELLNSDISSILYLQIFRTIN